MGDHTDYNYSLPEGFGVNEAKEFYVEKITMNVESSYPKLVQAIYGMGLKKKFKEHLDRNVKACNTPGMFDSDLLFLGFLEDECE